MSKNEISDLTKKIMDALVYSSKKMFEEKLKNDSMMVVSYHGKVLEARASEIAKLRKEEAQ
jgi:hypothetical protein